MTVFLGSTPYSMRAGIMIWSCGEMPIEVLGHSLDCFSPDAVYKGLGNLLCLGLDQEPALHSGSDIT